MFLKSYFILMFLSVANSSIMFQKSQIDLAFWNSLVPSTLPTVRSLEGCSLFCLKSPGVCTAMTMQNGICAYSNSFSYSIYKTKTAPTIDTWIVKGSATVTNVTSNRLLILERMYVSQYLMSSNLCFKLQLQDDGNLVITRMSNNQAVWASGKTGTIGTAFKIVLQYDGNLVITPPSNGLWAAGSPRSANYLEMQNDGRAFIYNSAAGSLWWSTLGGYAC